MNREEEIIKIGAQFAIDETDGQTSGRAASMRGVLLSAFRAGAHWADSHPHWIPVEEELPKKDGKYLFYDEVLGHEVSIYYDGVTLVPSITHWMPLPPAPRKEE